MTPENADRVGAAQHEVRRLGVGRRRGNEARSTSSAISTSSIASRTTSRRISESTVDCSGGPARAAGRRPTGNRPAGPVGAGRVEEARRRDVHRRGTRRQAGHRNSTGSTAVFHSGSATIVLSRMPCRCRTSTPNTMFSQPTRHPPGLDVIASDQRATTGNAQPPRPGLVQADQRGHEQPTVDDDQRPPAQDIGEATWNVVHGPDVHPMGEDPRPGPPCRG